MNSLLSNSGNIVIGLPDRFKLNDELASAREIRIASAYVRSSGWNMLSPYLKKGNARIFLLCGLDFSLSQPDVLKQWSILNSTEKVEARVFLVTGFYPKAMIVTRLDGSSFAIIGSGNLSAGGLRDNAELSVYLDDPVKVADALLWFKGFFGNDNLTLPIAEFDLDAYGQRYAEVAALRKTLQAPPLPIHRRVKFKASADKWKTAITEAQLFMQDPKAYASKNNPNWTPAVWQQNAERIKSALDYPRFNLTDERFREFYKIWTLGHLLSINRDKVFAQRDNLVSGLRQLVDESLPIEQRLDCLIGKNNPTYIKNFGINAATKILAVHNPSKWPVFNNTVYQALKDLEVKFTKPKDGSSYKDFADIMHEFISDAGIPDMIYLDCFFCNFHPPR